MAELINFQHLETLDESFFRDVKEILTTDNAIFPQGNHFARFTINAAGFIAPVIGKLESATIRKKRLDATEALGTLFLPLIELARDKGHLQGISSLLCDADTKIFQPNESHRGEAIRGKFASNWHIDYVHDYKIWDELLGAEGEELTTEVATGISDVYMSTGYGMTKEAHRESLKCLNEKIDADIEGGNLQISRPSSREVVAFGGTLVHRTPLNHTDAPINRTFIRVMPADVVQSNSI